MNWTKFSLSGIFLHTPADVFHPLSSQQLSPQCTPTPRKEWCRAFGKHLLLVPFGHPQIYMSRPIQNSCEKVCYPSTPAIRLNSAWSILSATNVISIVILDLVRHLCYGLISFLASAISLLVLRVLCRDTMILL